MDLGWLTAIVAAISGAVVTIWVHRATTRSSERLARATAEREVARRAEETLRERRALERTAVMALIAELRAAFQYQQSFFFVAMPIRMDVPGHGSVTEVLETDKIEEAFPIWWELQHEGLSVHVELITDTRVREAVRACFNVLDRAADIENIPGHGSVRELVARASRTGFLILGGWLRDESMTSDLVQQARELRAAGEALWQTPVT